MSATDLRTGLIVAALTPFRRGTTTVDEDRFDAELDFIARHRPVAVAVAGVEVQEYHVLTADQRVDLVKRAAERLGDVPVVAGVSAVSVDQACHLAERMAAVGAGYVLAVAGPKPWGAAPTTGELLAWYHALADVSPVPVFVYCNPRTGVDPSVDAIAEVAAHPNVAAMKETSRDVIKVLRLCQEVEQAGLARVYTNMESIQTTLAAGGSGAMMPPPALAIATALVAAIEAGDDAETRRLQSFFGRFPSAWMRLGLGPACKAAMGIVGCDVGDPVHPYDALGADEVASLREYLAGWGLAAGEPAAQVG
ncbi:MAG TPA: dihydrodipicolinate synthase family protein [Acidimicrobiales bacterium]